MTQTTSGIEPLFMPFYTRRVKVMDDKPYDFVDEVGDKWKEFLVIHEPLKLWYKVNGYKHLNDAKKLEELTLSDWEFLYPLTPYFKATSNDVDWLEKVRMQGRVQKWIDHSISVTINLPSDVSKELVYDLYIEAWKSGCKGCTVYRDGSRAGVLISATEPKEKSIEEGFTKRPATLPATLEVIKNKGRYYAIIIGYRNDKPYELFAFSDPFTTDDGVINGEITKKGSGIYSFTSDDYYIDNIIEETRSSEEGVITLMISMGLRHNVPLHYVIKNAEKAYPGFSNLTKAITVSLKQYIKDGSTSGEKCPECKVGELVYSSGCKECKNCGYSACS